MAAYTTALVTPDWWESYWKNRLILPKTFNPSLTLDRCIAKSINGFLTHDPEKHMIEVGCCPGKWMIYFHRTYGYQVSGVDYLPAGIEYTKTNLSLNCVDYEDLFCEDVLETEIEKRYDIVFSVGFIEHFTNVNPVLESHLDLAAPGGYVIVGLPRFYSVVGFLQARFDAVSENKILPSHNLDVMKLSVLRDFAENRPLKTLFLGYIGGFLPVLLKPGEAGVFAQAARDLMVNVRRKAEFLDQFNHHLISNYILAVFQKV
jgi:2-polyprenyl-3-methyl-5-hydroxy-6-metoxy-1,4-benzoquinol methylase